MHLTTETIRKVEELFKRKKWEIENDSTLIYSLFNRFCSRLTLFDQEKQDLLIEISDRFIDLKITEYQSLFIDAVRKIEAIDSYKSIIIAPLKKPSLSETKSADMIWYYLKTFDFSYESFGSRLYFCSNWDIIKKLIANSKTIVLLIDDFIGTGETVKKTLEELFGAAYLTPENIVKVVTFLAQAEGVNNINSAYPNVIASSRALDKGMSDYYPMEELQKKLLLMKEMEIKLKVKPEFEFGYGKSESLVAVLKRSVNNTFPVFWLEKNKNLAPFKR